jgi:hypothetical protein
MSHPLIDNLESLSNTEVEEKLLELQRKYFATSNPDLQMQISMLIDMYREEVKARRAKELQKLNNRDDESGLDSLINVS